MKPGDFVRHGDMFGQVTEIVKDVRAVGVRTLDGRSWFFGEDLLKAADLREVWIAIGLEIEIANSRLDDLRQVQRAAFERALKAGR